MVSWIVFPMSRLKVPKRIIRMKGKVAFISLAHFPLRLHFDKQKTCSGL